MLRALLLFLSALGQAYSEPCSAYPPFDDTIMASDLNASGTLCDEFVPLNYTSRTIPISSWDESSCTIVEIKYEYPNPFSGQDYTALMLPDDAIVQDSIALGYELYDIIGSFTVSKNLTESCGSPAQKIVDILKRPCDLMNLDTIQASEIQQLPSFTVVTHELTCLTFTSRTIDLGPCEVLELEASTPTGETIHDLFDANSKSPVFESRFRGEEGSTDSRDAYMVATELADACKLTNDEIVAKVKAALPPPASPPPPPPSPPKAPPPQAPPPSSSALSPLLIALIVVLAVGGVVLCVLACRRYVVVE